MVKKICIVYILIAATLMLIGFVQDAIFDNRSVILLIGLGMMIAGGFAAIFIGLISMWRDNDKW